MFGGRLKYFNLWLFSAPIFSHCSNFWKTLCKYYFTYLTVKVYSEYTPCESQKQPISENVEVNICLEFNLASIYLANSCAYMLLFIKSVDYLLVSTGPHSVDGGGADEVLTQHLCSSYSGTK